MLAAIPDMVHSPLRVGRPAIRNGWLEGRPRTGADGFHYVSWDEALDLVAGELTRNRCEFGPPNLFIFSTIRTPSSLDTRLPALTPIVNSDIAIGGDRLIKAIERL